MNRKWFLLCICFILSVACVLRIVTFYSHHFYIVPDEAHSLSGMKESLLYLFTHFEQGANFLPLYRSLLKIIYQVFDFNVLYFKLPSLLCGIASVFVFFELAKKVFKNDIIILCSLILFCFNYNLIYYSSQIKPYEFDVLLCLIITNFAFTIKDKLISNKTLILMAIFGGIFVYTSIPAIVVLHLCVAWLFILNKENRKKLFIFETVILLLLGIEYVTYIAQIHSDDSLKSMWNSDSFFFAPKSLSAVNALVNFSFFNFFWWDTHCPNNFSSFYLMSYLVIFLIGIINFLREKNIGLMVISPVLFFLVLSYLNIYPFCNRLIIFLIPLFILITLKAFDYNVNKYMGNFFALLLTIFFIFQVIKFQHYHYLFNIDKNYLEQVKAYLVPLNKLKEDEIVLFTGSPYWFCLKDESIYLIRNFELPADDVLKKKKKIYFAYNLVDDKQVDVDMFSEKLIQKGYHKSYLFDVKTEITYRLFVKDN